MSDDIFGKHIRTMQHAIAEDKVHALVNAMIPLEDIDRTLIMSYIETNFCRHCGRVLGGDRYNKCECTRTGQHG